MYRKMGFCLLLFPLFIFVFLLPGCGPEQQRGLVVGDHFPVLNILAIDGKEVTLSNQLAAQMRLLSIRTIGCRYCESDFQELERIRQRFSPKELDVVVVGVACERDIMNAFLENKTISFKVYVDEGAEVMRRTRSVLLPVAYLVDGAGVIQYKVRGALGQREIEEVLASLSPR